MTVLSIVVASALLGPAPLQGLQPNVPAKVKQWQVANTNTVQAGTEYQLHNLRRRAMNLTSQMGWTGRGYGWTGTSGGHFVFHRTNRNDHRTLRPEENVALYNTKAKRYLNSSLQWPPTPEYSWQVHAISGPNFALYNTTQRTWLILMESPSSGRHKSGEALAWHR
jgi:hypothetical protein